MKASLSFTKITYILICFTCSAFASKPKENVATLNAQDGENLLHWAVSNVQEKMIGQLIIDENTDPNIPDLSGDTPLHRAVKINNKKITQFFICNGADMNSKNNAGQTPLHSAIQNKSYELAKLLAYNGANSNIADKNGDTPLHFAIDSNEASLINFLIENGADVSVPDGKGNSALKRALLNFSVDNTKIIKILINNDSNANEIDDVIKDEELRKELKKVVKIWQFGKEKKIIDAENHLIDFKKSYSPKNPSTAFYHLAKALEAMDLEPSEDIEKLTATGKADADIKFNTISIGTLVFIPGGGEFSPRSGVNTILGEIKKAAKKNIDQQMILKKLKLYAKILPYHYKIHIMPHARQNTSNSSTILYFTDPIESLNLIEQIVRLYLFDRTFRSNIVTFKTMRNPTILKDTKGNVIPFIVIYPRARPGCAQKVARILDEKLMFKKKSATYPIIPTPRYNTKFNKNRSRSGIFYAMGDADFKGNKIIDELIFDKNVVLFNDTIAQMANYKSSFELIPDDNIEQVQKTKK